MNFRHIIFVIFCISSISYTPLAAQISDLRPYFPVESDCSWDYATIERETPTIINNSIWRTDDGGKIWSAQPVNASGTLRSIVFRDSLHGLIVGDDGIILRTNKGGNTWRRDFSPVITTLNAVAFGFMTNFQQTPMACAVGNNGIILRNVGTDTNWTQVGANLTSQNLNGITFFNGTTGFAVGNNKTILETNDGGQTWKKADVSQIPMLNIYAVAVALTPGWGEVYAVGDSGRIIRRWAPTLPNPWTQVFTQRVGVKLYSIVLGLTGSGNPYGWAVGQKGTVFTSSVNIGSSWTPLTNFDTENDLYSVFMKAGISGDSNSQIWIAGSDNTIFFTSDGGKSWENPTSLPTPHKDLLGITFSSSTRGFAVGSAEISRRDSLKVRNVHIWKKIVSRPGQKPRLLEIKHTDGTTRADYAYYTVTRTQNELTLLYESDGSRATILRADTSFWYSGPDLLYKFWLESTSDSLTTPAGTFYNCLKVRRELNRPSCQNHYDYIYFAQNIGIVKFSDFILCNWHKP